MRRCQEAADYSVTLVLLSPSQYLYANMTPHTSGGRHVRVCVFHISRIRLSLCVRLCVCVRECVGMEKVQVDKLQTPTLRERESGPEQKGWGQGRDGGEVEGMGLNL